MLRKNNAFEPQALGYLSAASIGAAALAGIVAAVGTAYIGDFSARSVAVATFYGAGILVVLVGIVRSTAATGRTISLAAIIAGTAAVVLIGALSFGPLFLPSLLLWGTAGFLRWHAGDRGGFAVVIGALWGFGLALAGSLAIPLVLGCAAVWPG
jgi:hypothetical protein